MQVSMTTKPQPQVDVMEQELIRRVREGDKEAFYGLVRPYERALLFAARSVLNNDADAEDAAQEAVLKELREALGKALASLEPKYRQVLVLRDIQHFSVAEAAEALGLSTEAVRTRLHRARLRMRDALAPGLGSAWIRGREKVRPSEAVRSGADMTVIEISCVEVWREISNFLEESVDPELRARMEAHFAVCSNCKAVLDGTKNVVKLIGDGQTFDVPAGFSERLFSKLR